MGQHDSETGPKLNWAIMRLAASLLILAFTVSAFAQTDLDKQNVVWTSPGRDASGSMPIGNGEVGLNVWVEENGDLLFYVSRTDAWSEASRLLKLGRVRVKITPNPFEKGKPFRQELILRDGRISIKAGPVDLNILVDAHRPVIHLTGQWMMPHTAVATLETWRTERRQLKGPELASSWTMQDAPIPIWESGDVLTADATAQILYHRNESTIVPFTLAHQDLTKFSRSVKDPLKDRFFGLRLEQNSSANGFTAAIAAESLQTSDPDKFLKSMEESIDQSKVADAAKRTVAWWRAFWDRSYIYVENDAAPLLPESKHQLRIGYDSGENNRFQGTIRNAVVYDRALSKTEVSELPAKQPSNPVISVVANHGRKPLVPKIFEGQTDQATYAHSQENAPFDLRRGFTVAALITPKAGVGRIFDMVTAGQSDGFLFDTHPGYALRAVVGDTTAIVPNILKEGEQAHVALIVTAQGGITIAKDGKVVYQNQPEIVESKVTQVYTLQRYVQACGGRGNYPIKFNGSIFTVEPKFLGQDFNPDWRRWGDCYWWQNTRLPYHAMPMAGDFDMMLPLFRLYEDAMPISRSRAQHYYDALGVYFPETMTIFGTYANKDYGWDRTGHKSNEVLSPWWMYAWNQTLELSDLMLDYQAPTPAGQKAFDDKHLKPMLGATMGYFTSRFKEVGTPPRLRITPTQAAETYWYDVVNDTPNIAGLRRVQDRVTRRFERKELEGWIEDKRPVSAGNMRPPSLPPIPMKGGKIAPAESYKDERSNVENPEFYAIWPFRLFGVGRGNEGIAQKTFKERIEKANSGWQYDGQVAALSGLTDDAKNSLLSKVRNSNPAFRWPASWGPNYDWLPDQCHGANIMITLQTMCLQEVDDKLYVLPAFPKDWNVKFKLHASKGAVVTAEYQKGKLVKASVTPANRTKDLVLP